MGLCLAVAGLTVTPVRPQGKFEGAAEPSVSVSYKLGKHLTQNASLTQRAFWYRNDEWALQSRHTELSVFTTHILIGGHRVSLGLGYRLSDSYSIGGANEFRITEQYNYAYRKGAVRFGHRFRAEQRFYPSRTQHRFRYRFSLDGPLQGERLDVGEFYWAAHGEQLLGVAQAAAPGYDLRAGFLLGYQLGPDAKWQAGWVYRLEDLNSSPGHALFLVGGLVLSL